MEKKNKERNYECETRIQKEDTDRMGKEKKNERKKRDRKTGRKCKWVKRETNRNQ